jgi:hypothetical protein
VFGRAGGSGQLGKGGMAGMDKVRKGRGLKDRTGFERTNLIGRKIIISHESGWIRWG